jgi:hypothetical protein
MATLTTTITEEVFLNGANRGSTNVLAVTGVNEVYHRIVNVPPSAISNITVLSTDSTFASGDVVIPSALKYVRFTNLSTSDTPYTIYLKVQTATSESVTVLGYGESFLMTDGKCYAGTGVDQAYTLTDLKTIKVGVTGGSCLGEIFVATA